MFDATESFANSLRLALTNMVSFATAHCFVSKGSRQEWPLSPRSRSKMDPRCTFSRWNDHLFSSFNLDSSKLSLRQIIECSCSCSFCCCWSLTLILFLNNFKTMYSVHFYELSPLIGQGIPSQMHPTQTRMKLSSTLRYLAMGVGLNLCGQNSRTRINVKRFTSIFLGRMVQHLSRTHPTQTLLRLERARVIVILLLRLITALLLLCSSMHPVS